MNAATIDLKVPSVGESVTEVEVSAWQKREGELVRQDETVVVLETDKATTELPAPVSGRLQRILKPERSRVKVGEVLAQIEPGDFAASPALVPQEARSLEAPAATPGKASPRPSPAPRVMPAAAHLMAQRGIAPETVQPTGPGGRILKEDVQRAHPPARPEQATASAPPKPAPAAVPAVEPPSETTPTVGTRPQELASPAVASVLPGSRREEVVPMTLLRRKIAERLVRAQQQAALLTTFNEIDMSAVMGLRREHQERFQERHQVKLGIMSFFVKAAVEALQEVPQLNAEIRDDNIVYRDYYDIGVAIGGGRGLVVPVLRHAERLSFAEVEQAIADFARRVNENRIKPDELQGGTFTITNGGVYGSLLSTPIINPPQSGVLGLHTIQDRPIALNGQVVIRPMMYVALTYDHRLVDGREAVTCLRRIKELVENPVRLLIEI